MDRCTSCGKGCGPPDFKECWAYNQVIPGALIHTNGTFFVYVAGQDYDGTDGGGRARIGIAHGPSLTNLTLEHDFLIEGTPGMADERSVFPNGALELANGSIAMTYMGQNHNDTWGGIFLATSNCPLGCPWQKHGPVLSCALGSAAPDICAASKTHHPAIHEHDLVQLENGTFVIFYAGNLPAGDQGYIATSEDLLTWHNFPGNPAMPLPIKECGQYPDSMCWDGGHRRPRSLYRHGDYWYLIYEGTNQISWTGPNGAWGDTVGLLRSRDIEGPWVERHPLQISIPPQADPSFDSTWTGWPRAYVDNASGEVQVLYAAGGRGMKNSTMHPYASTGLRRWSLDRLGQWTPTAVPWQGAA